MNAETVIANRNAPINDNNSSEFVSADHVVISCGPPGEISDLDLYYAIGLTQRIDYRDARQVVSQGEIGSNSTLTMIGESQKSLSLNKTIIKGNSLLYALYYAQYKAEGNNDFKKFADMLVEGFDVPVSNDYGADDVIGGSDVMICVASPGATDPPELTELDVIGLTQGFQLQSNMPIKQLSEMGTHASFIVAGKAEKSMSFSRILLEAKSALALLYDNSDSKRIIQDLQNSEFRVPKDIYLLFMNKDNDGADSIITLEKAVVTTVGSQNAAGDQSTVENLGLSWNKTRYNNSNGVSVNALEGDYYGIGLSNTWLDLDHRIFREQFNLMLTYCDVDNNVLCHQILNRALMSSMGVTFAAGAYTTVEGGALSWENTVTLQVAE